MTPDERWLAAVWPFVRAGLPSPPAAVLEIGCGRLGGFVPALLRDGYDAVGVDPEAPEGPGYHRIEFEAYQSPRPVDGVVAPPDSAAEPGWLHRRRDEWAASGQPWDGFCRAWATQEGLHSGEEIVRGLDARFDRRRCGVGPYFFADLADTTEADEQAAIDAGQVQASGIWYTGRRR